MRTIQTQKLYWKENEMKKYLVKFPTAMIEVWAENYDDLYDFIDKFYPDTAWDYETIS